MPAPKSLNEALLAVQRNAPAIQRDAINPAFARGSSAGSKYISLDGLMPKILPLLNENQLVLTQAPSHIDGAPALTTRLTYVTPTVHPDQYIESTMPLILDKQNSQGQGSAITYARRYSLLSILGLVADVDDDANAASKGEVEVVNRRKPAERKKAAVVEGDSDGGW
jgi:hypothetical protein